MNIRRYMVVMMLPNHYTHLLRLVTSDLFHIHNIHMLDIITLSCHLYKRVRCRKSQYDITHLWAVSKWFPNKYIFDIFFKRFCGDTGTHMYMIYTVPSIFWRPFNKWIASMYRARILQWDPDKFILVSIHREWSLDVSVWIVHPSTSFMLDLRS